MRAVSTDLKLLISEQDFAAILPALPEIATSHGYTVKAVHVDVVTLSCEPDNMLVTQYEQQQGRTPINEVLHSIVIHGNTDLSLVAATNAIVAALPDGAYWYGTTYEGTTEPGVTAACAWRS